MLLSFSHPGVYAWVITTKLGTEYGNRTRLCDLKGHRPKPIDEPSINCGHRGQSRTAASCIQDRDATVTFRGDKIGAVDGTRTRLNLIDNQVPFPEDYYGIFLAGVIGFEPMILISKTSALGQTKLNPNNV